jgi:hypothetical protein
MSPYVPVPHHTLLFGSVLLLLPSAGVYVQEVRKIATVLISPAVAARRRYQQRGPSVHDAVTDVKAHHDERMREILR